MLELAVQVVGSMAVALIWEAAKAGVWCGMFVYLSQRFLDGR